MIDGSENNTFQRSITIFDFHSPSPNEIRWMAVLQTNSQIEKKIDFRKKACFRQIEYFKIKKLHGTGTKKKKKKKNIYIYGKWQILDLKISFLPLTF